MDNRMIKCFSRGKGHKNHGKQGNWLEKSKVRKPEKKKSQTHTPKFSYKPRIPKESITHSYTSLCKELIKIRSYDECDSCRFYRIAGADFPPSYIPCKTPAIVI